MVFKSSEYSQLAGSLATVAIACLGGPVAAGGAVLAGLVKNAQAWYEVTAPTRDLRRQVVSGIRQWAESEHVTTDAVNRGLALAVEAIQRFGLDLDAIAALDFDPQEASARVLDRVKAKDSSWGTEDDYEVASRAIRVTYAILIDQLKASEKGLLPAIQALRASIDDYMSRVEVSARSTTATLDGLVSALIEAGTVTEVMAFLRSRIVDWDRSVWHQGKQTSSTVERPLRVRTLPRPGSGIQEMAAEEALAGQRMLVVLGGPGSGKTRLAYRLAREAAQTALSRLENGADLDEVELPLFTTWDRWTKTSGSPRQSLVAASFESGLGHSDLEWGDSNDRLQRTFTRQGTKVLLILDSLDEAADVAGQANRLYEVTAMAGWRVVVTSRPAAWDATYRDDANRADAPAIVQLQDLTYPADVDTFIQTWFATDPGRGDALTKQIRDRPDLALVAVIPLLLTFYCLLTESADRPAQPLPARRQDLYQRLAKRLLLGNWAAHAPKTADVEYCVRLLTDWAWLTVQGWTTASGLGNWDDSFQQPTPPREGQSRFIDNLAPKVSEDDEGQLTRRFVHRTMLEHFVAEHISTVEADEAVRILLPHLWFDPVWKVVAPAAIAAHNLRQKGVLLGQLIDVVVHPAKDPGRLLASRELDKLLLAIAEESDPGDWTPDHQDLFHSCRHRNAVSEPTAVARTAHWVHHSNQKARTELLNALHTADPYTSSRLLEGLLALVPTDVDREQARTELLNALPTAHQGLSSYLVEGLLALEPTDTDRAQVRTVLLSALSTAEPYRSSHLVEGLLALEPTDADRAQARTALLSALSTANPYTSTVLVEGLLALEPNDADQAQARTALLDALPTAEPYTSTLLVEGLLALEPNDADRAQARTALLDALSTAEALSIAEPNSSAHRVRALVALVTTDADRAQARAALLNALLNALPTVEPHVSYHLAEMLLALEPTDADRAQARTALLNALPTADPYTTSHLAELLLALEPTDADRAQVRNALLHALPTTDLFSSSRLLDGLLALEPTDADRAEARTALLSALSATKPDSSSRLVEGLLALVTTDADRAQARTGLLNALPTTHPDSSYHLVEGLLALEPTDTDRAQARTALLNALTTAHPYSSYCQVEGLLTLEPTDADRAQARTALLNALPTAGTWSVSHLVTALRSASRVDSWLAWLANK